MSLKLFIDADGSMSDIIKDNLNGYPHLVRPVDRENADVQVACFDKQALMNERITSLDPATNNIIIWACTNLAPQNLGKAIHINPVAFEPLPISMRILSEAALHLSTEERPQFIAYSSIMKTMMEKLTKFAKTDLPILLTGETGTGKSLIAKEAHHLSGRSDPFLAVNAGEFPEGLLVSEVFGYAKGAFTGAVKNKDGLIKAAGTGSFFLDEIGELTKDQQTRLLQVLENRELRPIGATEYEEIEARFIFATNKDLDTGVEEGSIREDFHERLNSCSLHVPSLRERRVDLLAMANLFLQQFNEKQGTQLALTSAAKNAIFKYPWPRNVRELKNVIDRSAALSDNSFAEQELIDHLSRKADRKAPSRDGLNVDPASETWEKAQNRLKREYFKKLLTLEPSKKKAADIAGISRARIYEIIDELEGKKKEKKQSNWR